MKYAEKVNQIEKWYVEGKIKKLGSGCYSVPSEAFAMGITPTLVNQVIKQKPNFLVKEKGIFKEVCDIPFCDEPPLFYEMRIARGIRIDKLRGIASVLLDKQIDDLTKEDYIKVEEMLWGTLV